MAGSKTRGIGAGAAVRRIARPSSSPPAVESTETATPGGAVSAASAAGVADAPVRGGVSIVAALQREGGRAATTVLTLDPADVAEHPDNPRESLGDLDGLTASVRELGVLQPILVVPRQEYLTAYPHHADHVGEKSWITVAGHRRRAAALEAGLAGIPALTRADLADPHSAIRTFLAENVHRQQLSPLEEARAFAMLVELGLSQRTIAAQNGVSQAHVSKRLRLLQLPPQAQDAVRDGSLTIGDALVLTDAPEEDRNAAFLLALQRDLPMTTAVGHIAQHRRDAARHTEDDTHTSADGDLLGQEATAVPEQGAAPSRAASTRNRGTATSSAARSAGSHDAADDGPGETVAISDRGSGAQDAIPADAVEVRADACRRLVRTQPAAARMLEDLAVAVLHGLTLTPQPLTLAHRWIGDQIGAPQEDPEAWRGSVVERDRPRMAWTLAIASLHLRAADPDQVWATPEAHLAHQLTRTGWLPTLAEAARLQQIEDWQQVTATTTSSDSTESPQQTAATPQPVKDPQEGPDA